MKLPALYKKTSTGAIQFWEIKTAKGTGLAEKHGAYAIVTVFGQLNTDKPQQTVDEIWEGKNVGKKNETTPQQQAESEAKSKWEKQKKKGYVESIEAAEAGEVDDLIEGGVNPMLAQSFTKHGAKIKFPCHVQPKLDGIRCVAIVEGGVCTLWSRTRKPITSCPHIVQELEALFEFEDIILDGELYNHAYKKDFEKIVSLVRQEEPAEDHYLVQYHVYDVINDEPYFERLRFLKDYILDLDLESSIKMVHTGTVNEEDDVSSAFDTFVAAGFEGAMLRNSTGKYVGKRSYDLQKVKEFEDAEFPIVRVEEGRGKLAGHAIFVCRAANGKEFEAKMRGETSRLKEFFENPNLWTGKQLTVQYQGLTGKSQVPRFPVGVAVRDYE